MEMKQHIELFQLACKYLNKFGMLISFDPGVGIEETMKAAPYLDIKKFEHFNVLVDGSGYLFFDTEEEMLEYYNNTVGDDGPTKTNKYCGKQKVYALTCNNHGNLGTENT